MKTALVLVDIQNDYFPGGKMELSGSLEAGRAAAQALAVFRGKGWPVFHIQHLAIKPGASFFIPGTAGAEIHPFVAPSPTEAVIQKNFPNSFRNTDLLEKLREQNIERIVVAGMMTHMCIDTTVRAAKDYGIPVTLLYDACAARDLKIMEHSIPAQTVQDAYMAGLNGMFAEIKLAEQLEL